MKLLAASLALSLLAAAANAHTFLSSVNGNQASVRRFSNFPRNFPLWDIASRDMTCGRSAEPKAASTVSTPAGTSVKLLWGHDNPGDDIIASSHKGPCNFYLSKASEVNTNGWFKIFERRFDATRNEWCTDFLIRARGIIDIPIPTGLAPGDYVLRSEIIALHEADRVWPPTAGDNGPGAQLYIFCADLQVTGTGTLGPVPNSKVAIPGTAWVASQRTPGIFFNIYGQPNNVLAQYPVVGPALATFQTDITAPPAAPVTPPAPPAGQPANPPPAPTPSASSSAFPSPSTVRAPQQAPIPSIDPVVQPSLAPMPPGVAPLPPPPAPVPDGPAAPVTVEYVKVWQAANTFGAEVRITAVQASVTINRIAFALPNAQVITGVALAAGRYDGSDLVFTLLDNNRFLKSVDSTTYLQIEGTYNSINDGPSTGTVSVNGQSYTVAVTRRSQLDNTGELPKARPANFGGSVSNAHALAVGPAAICVALVAGYMAL